MDHPAYDRATNHRVSIVICRCTADLLASEPPVRDVRPTVVASKPMATQKRSISFDESVLREAEQRVAGSSGNLSAFVNAAVLHELQVTRGRELLAKDDIEFGAISPEVTAQVLGEWPA